MQKQKRRPTTAIATLVFGAALTVAASSAVAATANTGSNPAGTGRPAAASTGPAFPTFVHLPADQAAHPNTPIEWWYVVGHVNAHGHRFGYSASTLARAVMVGGRAAGAGQTVAIVDAFDDPERRGRLNVCRAQYGLPPCTTANGCFRKVDQVIHVPQAAG